MRSNSALARTCLLLFHSKNIQCGTETISALVMRFAALLSGGKDSCYSIQRALELGHELVCLVHLHPVDAVEEMNRSPRVPESSFSPLFSYMYQSAAHSAVPLLASCLEVPMVRWPTSGSAHCQRLEYDPTAGDEVEDLFEALQEVKRSYPEVEAVSCGAIVSSYQRSRVENVCLRLGLQSMALLWERDRGELLLEMLDRGIEAVLVKVAGAGLLPEKHLGKSLRALYPTLVALNKKFGLDLCGEGGEYESLVLDCEVFKRRLVIDQSDVVLDPEDPTVGNLRVISCHCEEKPPRPSPSIPTTPSWLLSLPRNPLGQKRVDESRSPITHHLRIRASQRICHTALMVHPSPLDFAGDMAIEASRQLRQLLLSFKTMMEQQSSADFQGSLNDAVFVHLYISDLSLFTSVNDTYSEFFSKRPPSRSCVVVPLPPGSLVAIDFLLLFGSNSKLQGESSLRKVLHVQSRSEWAPQCIGPYSQANVIFKTIVFVAGQIFSC